MNSRGTVLYIDDEQENLTGFMYSFNDNYTIYTASTIEEANSFLDSKVIHVVIADQRMPGDTGIDFLITVTKRFPDISTILLTAYADVGVMEKAINQLNVFRFIQKPWIYEDMNNSIAKAVEAYTMQSENKRIFQELRTVNSGLIELNNQLKESEQKFRNIFESSHDPIIISSMDGAILEANNSFLHLSGFQKEELNEMKEFSQFTHNKIISKLEDNPDKNVSLIDFQVRTRKGNHLTIEICSQIIFHNNNQVVLSIIRDITERRNTERSILNAIIETEERERKRFAEDIHDGIGPLLSALRLYVNALESKTYSEEKELDIFKNVNQILTESIETAKTISNKLMPNVLNEFGLIAALQLYVNKINASNVLQIDFESRDYISTNKFNEIIIYRTIVELINNTIKYAQAKKVVLKLIYLNQALMVVYTDDGIGFDILAKKNEPGMNMGIKNMFYRLSSINATIDYFSEAGKGVNYKFIIPTNG